MIQPPPLIYRLLSIILFFFWLIHACWHALKFRQPSYIWQRLGICPAIRNHALWFHASSVGEVELVKPLLQSLSLDHPIVLTTFTATGYQHARRIMPAQILVRVMPIDFYPLSRWFIERHRFHLGLIAETELWPETLYQARKQGINLLRINARLSSRSLKTNALVRQILQRTLGYFNRHLTRNDSDVEHLRSMGIPPEHIAICGNLKHASTNEQHYDNLIGRPYILFASTHAPEEQQFAELMLQSDYQELAVIAPRHPQRAGEIMKALRELDVAISQRSKQQAITAATGLYLADTLGELKALMAHARLVVMAGSFNDTGGHNLLEPARLGKAIITGPSDDNIRSDIEFLRAHNAIIQVSGIDELGDQMTRLLDSPDELQVLGDNAREATRLQDHVLQDYLNEIRGYLGESP